MGFHIKLLKILCFGFKTTYLNLFSSELDITSHFLLMCDLPCSYLCRLPGLSAWGSRVSSPLLVAFSRWSSCVVHHAGCWKVEASGDGAAACLGCMSPREFYPHNLSTVCIRVRGQLDSLASLESSSVIR